MKRQRSRLIAAWSGLMAIGVLLVATRVVWVVPIPLRYDMGVIIDRIELPTYVGGLGRERVSWRTREEVRSALAQLVVESCGGADTGLEVRHEKDTLCVRAPFPRQLEVRSVLARLKE